RRRRDRHDVALLQWDRLLLEPTNPGNRRLLLDWQRNRLLFGQETLALVGEQRQMELFHLPLSCPSRHLPLTSHPDRSKYAEQGTAGMPLRARRKLYALSPGRAAGASAGPALPVPATSTALSA